LENRKNEMVSVIIPIYNEERILSENSSYFGGLSGEGELIFVDGNSSDGSAEIAGKYGRVLFSERGRALQMNCGARSANGEILLFLHADAVISPATVSSIEAEIRNSKAIGGCLTQRIDKNGFSYRFIENFGNRRARATKIFYGDQGIFVKKKEFFEIGAFPYVPVMEDVIFTKKMRRLGETAVLTDEVLVSPRRWEKQGVLRTTAFYSSLNILFWAGVPPDRIKKLYGDIR